MEEKASSEFDDAPVANPTSLRDRIINVFVSPGEVFEEVINSPPTPANWLVPILITCLVGVISFFCVFQQPFFPNELRTGVEIQIEPETETQASHKAKNHFEDAGWLSRAKLGGELAIVSTSFIGAYWSALVLWLMGRFLLKARFPFMKALEIVGLTGMILVLSTLITSLLVFATENAFAKPALSLLVTEFDPTNKFHLLLSLLDVTAFWTAGVLSIGLARLSKVTVAESAFWVFGYWVVLRGGLLLLR